MMYRNYLILSDGYIPEGHVTAVSENDAVQTARIAWSIPESVELVAVAVP